MRKDNLADKLLAGRSILIVEDEYFLADDLARAVKSAGGHVAGIVGDCADAIALLKIDRLIDGAILDLNLRGEMSYPIADILRDRGIPFIFATGYDEAAISSGYENVRRLEKPFDASVLAHTLVGTT